MFLKIDYCWTTFASNVFILFMKRIFRYPIMFVLVLSMFAGCKKDDKIPINYSDPVMTGRSMAAQINGKYEEATSVSGTRSNVNNAHVLYITGTFSDGHQLTITVVDFKEAGTYALNNSAAAGTGTASWVAAGMSQTSSDEAKDGMFAVTNCTQTSLTGTFYFDTYGATQITQGSITVLF